MMQHSCRWLNMFQLQGEDSSGWPLHRGQWLHIFKLQLYKVVTNRRQPPAASQRRAVGSFQLGTFPLPCRARVHTYTQTWGEQEIQRI